MTQYEFPIESKKKKSARIPIDKLHDFDGHPYKVTDNEDMDKLVESIKSQGIISPLIVRLKDNTTDEYEVISGHRRLHASKRAGLTVVPALIYPYTKTEAEIAVVDSNLHRECINNLGTMQQNKDRFIGAIRRFMEMQKLTAPLLRELIDEITVYETEGVGKNRSQRIMIHYKFIGYIEIPECGSNYKADTRKGVVVEYITKSA